MRDLWEYSFRILTKAGTFIILLHSSLCADFKANLIEPYLGTGYSISAGALSNHVTSGYNLSLGGLYPLKGYASGFFYDARFSYSIMNVSLSEDSFFEIYSLGGGASYRYPLSADLQLQSTMMLQGAAVSYIADKSDSTSSFLRPAAFVSAGILFDAYAGFSIKPAVSYKALPLAGSVFHEVQFSVSAVFNEPEYRAHMTEERRDTWQQVRHIIAEAEDSYTKGDFKQAGELFKDVLSLQPENDIALFYISQIEKKESQYRQALESLEKGRSFEALQHLEAALPMKEAEEELEQQRRLMQRMIPEMRERGRKAYEAREYEECISIMRRILLIDPDDSTAKLYLPRAERRKRAMEELR